MALYPQEFQELLNEYLTDGVISARERQALLNKARNLGLDVEEVDLYLDAQQHKLNQQMDAAGPARGGRRCPHCGSDVPDLTELCPYCDNLISPQANRELTALIENLEEALFELKTSDNFAKSKAKVERYAQKAELYYGSNPKIKILLKQVAIETEKARKNEKKNFFKRNRHWVIYGSIMLLEFIFACYCSIKADSLLSDYHNYIGNRADTYSQSQSFEYKAEFMMGLLVITMLIAFIHRMISVATRKVSSFFSRR